MSSSPSRYFVLLLLCSAIALPLRSQEPPFFQLPSSTKPNGTAKKSMPAAESKKAAEQKKLDLASLPADAVLVICESVNEALDRLPKAVILSPDKYQELLDRIEKLKKQIENPKSENVTPPTRCILRGKVESNAVRLEAEFAGTAEHADTLVSLACAQAAASSAETDGRMARIRRSSTGAFLVRIDKPGEYHVKLDLLVPLAGREGNGRGFELTLPRAVITQLELELPANCTDVRTGGQLLKDLQLPGLELKNNQLRGNPGLGPVDKLDLSWKEVRRFSGDPVRTAEGRIQVRLDAAGLATEADLWLTVEGAPAKTWRLLVPRNADIKILPSEKEGPIEHRLETVDRNFASLRTIHLREARSQPLHAQVSLRLPAPRTGKALPIGPFFVLDAARQTGTVLVRNQVRNLHLDYRGHGDMQLRRLMTEESKGEAPATVATLVYSAIPMVEKPEGTVGPKSLSWLDLETVKVPTQVRMRVSHTLILRPARAADQKMANPAPLQWHIVTTIAPAMKWPDIEQLKILVPAGWESTDENVSVMNDKNSHYTIIPSPLLRESPTQSQRLEGRYSEVCRTEGRAMLKLPRPQGTIESCVVRIEAPAATEVSVNNAEQANLEPSRQTRPNEQAWNCRGLPVAELGIELSWRPYRPELRVASVVDLTLKGNRGEVRHEMRMQLPPTPPTSLTLRVPAAIREGLRILDDRGQEVRLERIKDDGGRGRPDRFVIHPPASPPPETAKDGNREWRLLLQYTTRLGEKERGPRSGEPFVVPLATLEEATASDRKVRIWSELGFLPRVAGSRWEQQNIEEAPDRALPVLVLHSARLDSSLRLVLDEQPAGFAALIERVQMRVQLEESGAQNWKATFRLRQLADNDLDIVMPAPIALLNAQFFFNRRKVTPDLINEKGEGILGGNIARLHLSADLVRQSALVEVAFQSPPGRSGGSPLHTTLQPPRILRATAAPICWQVCLPGNRVLLAPESAAGVERVWTWRDWLLAASLTMPPDLRQDQESSALVCWRDEDIPLVLTHVPKRAWLLVCSLGLLIPGLGLYWSARPHPNQGGRPTVWFWPILALLTLAVAVAALFWPGLLSAIAYGGEPGAVVLLAVLAGQWLMQQRYRRQIVFLPSFSRGRTGSSLSRKSPSHRPQCGEPSTVDAPPPFVEDQVTG